MVKKMKKNTFFFIFNHFFAPKWSKVADNCVKWSKLPHWTQIMDFEKIEKNFPKTFRISGVVTDFQIDNFQGSGLQVILGRPLNSLIVL